MIDLERAAALREITSHLNIAVELSSEPNGRTSGALSTERFDPAPASVAGAITCSSDAFQNQIASLAAPATAGS